MAIEYVGGQIVVVAGVTSAANVTFNLTGGLASTPAAGDLVIIAYVVGSTADRALTIGNPNGAVAYTLVDAEQYVNDTFDTNMRVAYRFMPTPTETQFQRSGTGNTADGGILSVRVYRGVDPTNPLDVAAVVATGLNSRIPNPGPITPVTAGARIVWFGGAACGTGAAFTPGAYTNWHSNFSPDTNDAIVGAGCWAWDGTPPPLDGLPFSGGGTSTTNDSWCAFTLALRPAAAAISLTVHDMAVGVAMDSPALVQANVLSVADARSTIAMDAPGLVQANTLVVHDARSLIAMDSPALVQAFQLTVHDMRSTVAMDGVTISFSPLLVVHDARSLIAMDSPALVQANVLSVADLRSLLAMDGVALTQAHTLAVHELRSLIAMESPGLVQAHVLVVHDARSLVTADGVTLAFGSFLSPADLRSLIAMDSPALVQAFQLAVHDMRSLIAIEGVALTQSHVLTVDDLRALVMIDGVALVQAHTLTVDGMQSLVTMDDVVLAIGGAPLALLPRRALLESPGMLLAQLVDSGVLRAEIENGRTLASVEPS